MTRTASSVPVAVIVDIVGSRTLADRTAAQTALEAVFRSLDDLPGMIQPLRPTVGDEFQALYDDLDAALFATAMARLALPDGIDCRFGLGLGGVQSVGAGERPVQDGPGWWNARLAIEEAHRNEDARNPTSRSWYRSTADEAPSGSAARAGDPDGSDPREPIVNAYLLARDHLISSMSPRARALAAGTLLGRPQRELADEQGISQSAVSQSIRRSGGSALLSGLALVSRGSRVDGRRS